MKEILDWLFGIGFVAAFLGANWFVADVPDRKVVMTEAEFHKQIAAERIDAARKVMDAQRCDRLSDQFRWTPKKAPM